jgi:hypothetical protein
MKYGVSLEKENQRIILRIEKRENLQMEIPRKDP